jgi:hypothetical protein
MTLDVMALKQFEYKLGKVDDTTRRQTDIPPWSLNGRYLPQLIFAATLNMPRYATQSWLEIQDSCPPLMSLLSTSILKMPTAIFIFDSKEWCQPFTANSFIFLLISYFIGPPEF